MLFYVDLDFYLVLGLKIGRKDHNWATNIHYFDQRHMAQKIVMSCILFIYLSVLKKKIL